MGLLIDQFCEAAREWKLKTGEREDGVAWYAMGHIYKHPTWGIAVSSLLQDRPSIGRMKQCLEQLVHDGVVSEYELIAELTRAVEDDFETLSERV